MHHLELPQNRFCKAAFIFNCMSLKRLRTGLVMQAANRESLVFDICLLFLTVVLFKRISNSHWQVNEAVCFSRLHDSCSDFLKEWPLYITN